MEHALEELVWQRARGRCEYCQMPQARTSLKHQVDHIIAEKHHGMTRANNLALACFACNNHKGPNIAGLDRQTRKTISLFNPRRNKWARHFRWSGAILVGRTAIGRATVDVLAINLPHRVAVRQALLDEGVSLDPQS